MKRDNVILILLIILVGLITYVNIYSNDFLWDDEFLIQKNLFIRSFKYVPDIFQTPSGGGVGRLDNFYRPMQQIAYTFVFQIAGLVTWPFHLLNHLLHIINAVLIFLLLNKIFNKIYLSLFTSLLWVSHPIQTEAVTYMSGTADPLSLFFALTSFLFYISFKEKKNKKLNLTFYFLSILFFILSLLSKETMVIFPGILFLYDFIKSKDKFNIRNYYSLIAFALISIFYFILRLTILNFGSTLNLYQESNVYTENLYVRILTFLASLISYYSFLIFPVNLHMERDFPFFTNFFSGLILFSLLIFLILFYLSYKSYRGDKIFFFSVFWFFICFIPMSGIIPINSLLLEHWLYIPSIGFFMILSYVLLKLFEKKELKKYAIGILILLLVLSVSLSFQRNKDWSDPITFYNNILKYEPGTPRLFNNLGMAYADKGELELAEENYKQSILLYDFYPQPHYNLARIYLLQNKTESALIHLNKSLEINPNFFYSYQLLSVIYAQKGDIEKSKEYYDKANSINYY